MYEEDSDNEGMYRRPSDVEDEEECPECLKGLDEVPDVDNAVDYLTKNRLIILDWDAVEVDLNQADENGQPLKSIVDCLLDNTYINVNDPCLLDAGQEVIRVFRANRNSFETIEDCWDALVETMSKTYSSCSSEFRQKVNQSYDGE